MHYTVFNFECQHVPKLLVEVINSSDVYSECTRFKSYIGHYQVHKTNAKIEFLVTATHILSTLSIYICSLIHFDGELRFVVYQHYK